MRVRSGVGGAGPSGAARPELEPGERQVGAHRETRGCGGGGMEAAEARAAARATMPEEGTDRVLRPLHAARGRARRDGGGGSAERGDVARTAQSWQGEAARGAITTSGGGHARAPSAAVTAGVGAARCGAPGNGARGGLRGAAGPFAAWGGRARRGKSGWGGCGG